MDFWKFVTTLKTTANKALDASVQSLQKTGAFVIQDVASLEAHIALSKNTTGPSGKVYEKTTLLIVGDPETNFFKEALYKLPVLYTKAWSQNISLKLISSKCPWFESTKYNITELPSFIVFHDTKVAKIIAWEEKLNTLVKSLSLDILSAIETL